MPTEVETDGDAFSLSALSTIHSRLRTLNIDASTNRRVASSKWFVHRTPLVSPSTTSQRYPRCFKRRVHSASIETALCVMTQLRSRLASGLPLGSSAIECSTQHVQPSKPRPQRKAFVAAAIGVMCATSIACVVFWSGVSKYIFGGGRSPSSIQTSNPNPPAAREYQTTYRQVQNTRNH